MANEKRYHFLKNTSPREGKVAAVFAGVSAAFFILAGLIAFVTEANAALPAGALAIPGICFSIYGFRVGFKALSGKSGSSAVIIMGTIASGIMMVVWSVLILVGLQG
ncbi:MAG: hypothetical protein K6E30_06615 [Lachnospiraceae bacterium]|nr:hypothetical protein [Lachnospiraceae bacterium]